jgi:hypothetical protein
VAALCLLGGAMLAVVAPAAASNLARGFGTGGVVKLRGVVEDPSELAVGPGGAIFTLGRDDCNDSCDPRLAVSKFNPDGTLARGYGVDGRAPTTLEVGSAAAFTVDRRGRALVMMRTGNYAPASIVRLDSGGRSDESFGVGGLAVTPIYGGFPDLGLGLTTRGGFYTFAFWQKSVFSPGDPRRYTAGVVSIARFATDGTVDRDYGRGGELRRSLPGVTDLGAVAERRSGGVVVFGTTCCGKRRLPYAVRVTGSGRLDRRFGRWRGFGGIHRVGSYLTTAAIARPSGKIDLYGEALFKTGKRMRERAGFAVRLRRNGRPWGRFGPRHGIRFAAWPFREAALDGLGRTVALTYDFASGGKAGVFRLQPGGASDRSFAYGGLATTPLPIRSENVSLSTSRYRPVVLDEAPEACAFRGPPMCTPANPTLVAFRGGPYRKRARR